MSANQVRLDLSYTVTITRQPDEIWPRLKVDANYQADVTQVAVKVLYEDGELVPQTPDITQGRRVLRNGTLGARIPNYHGYYSFWERDAQRDVITAQASKFQDQALAIATQEFARLLGASLTVEGAGNYDRR